MATASHGKALHGTEPAATAANELDAYKRVTFNAQCRIGIRPGKGVMGRFHKVHQTTGRALQDIVRLGLALMSLADPG